MDIAYELLGCRFFLQTWALDPGRVKDRALQQLASQPLDFSILHGCLEVLKKNCFLYVNLSDFAPRQPGALLGSSGACRRLALKYTQTTNIIEIIINTSKT